MFFPAATFGLDQVFFLSKPNLNTVTHSFVLSRLNDAGLPEASVTKGGCWFTMQRLDLSVALKVRANNADLGPLEFAPSQIFDFYSNLCVYSHTAPFGISQRWAKQPWMHFI